MKYDASGNVLWAKSEGESSDELVREIHIDQSGNVLVIGYFFGPSLTLGATTLINAGAGSSDIFIAKYDASRNALWAKSAGGTGHDQGICITTD